jgi:hypothetical protein
MDLIALQKGVEDMVVNIVLISIISVVAVMIVNDMLDSEMKSLWIMMKKKGPLMIRIPLVVVEDFVGDMPKSPSSQYGLKAQEDIDPRGIRVTNGPMR